MIKYLGSKRRLVPRIVALAQAIPGARRALDLFTGTTRVAQGLKRAGLHVTANDLASYSEVLAQAYIQADARTLRHDALAAMLEELNALPGVRGYFTRTFCEDARYVQPANGMRVDAIRTRIETITDDATERAVLLTALLEATDRVDSTTGLQMAYLKEWSARSHRPLRLRMPNLLPGAGVALRRDATQAVRGGRYDVAYLDPPYNQHSYYRNYHVWETLVRGDAPPTYGIANKREDCRRTRSAFNLRGEAAAALQAVIDGVEARHVILSFSDEGFHPLPGIHAMLSARFGDVAGLPVPSKRYVGAKIGIFSRSGELVGAPGHLTNTEWLFVAGPDAEGIVAAAAEQPLAEVA
ncbi:MAG: DNA adenine methylase [Gemmatimonadaceae bacterium]|nr:DNA adenine methylase [Gemmatimonadaceae bacterium]MCW5827126.1 DNA adenine methylase [Gemmatimonadaceae bacterium]